MTTVVLLRMYTPHSGEQVFVCATKKAALNEAAKYGLDKGELRKLEKENWYEWTNGGTEGEIASRAHILKDVEVIQ